MTDDYDPFKDFDPNRELHQRINQTMSQAGCRAVLDFTEIDVLTEQFELPPQTTDHNMRRLAASTVEEHLTFRDKDSNGSLLFGFDPSIAFDRSEIQSQIAKLKMHRTCDVNASTRCQTDCAELVLTVNYGDWVCVYKLCDVCLDWFSDDNRAYEENVNFAPSFPTFGNHVAT